MHSKTFLVVAGLIFSVVSLNAVAIAPETVRLSVWKRGETISGLEFVAASEAVSDYLDTLKRPTDPLKAIRYNCQVKGRYTRPEVTQFGSTSTTTQYANIIMLYDIKDCVETTDQNP